MKFKNAEAMSYFEAMKDCHETGKLGYAIAKNMRKIRDELKEYSEKIDELARKHGEDLGDGRFKVADMKAYLEDRKQYDDIESEFDVMQVDEDVFTGGTLTSDKMFILDWMVKN